MEKKIIAVVGATGAQGGGLVRAILSDPKDDSAFGRLQETSTPIKRKRWQSWAPRLSPPMSTIVESLKRAFAGAYGVYCVTFFWAHFSPEKEIANATAMAHAAKQAGIEACHLVHLRRHAQVGAAHRQPHADSDGQI